MTNGVEALPEVCDEDLADWGLCQAFPANLTICLGAPSLCSVLPRHVIKLTTRW